MESGSSSLQVADSDREAAEPTPPLPGSVPSTNGDRSGDRRPPSRELRGEAPQHNLETAL